MRFLWFHLMPYPDFPPDFKQNHPSVWVDIDPRLFDPVRAHALYNEYMDEMEYAAECGFDAICVNEHHANGYGLMPSPNLIATALARRTSDAAICVLGSSLALYDPPTRVAEEFAMVDCISGGRLIAGLPVGTPMDTCFAYGQNPSMLRQRYLEAHDLIKECWRRDDVFAFNGRFNQQRYVNTWPRPIQQPPPIWIPGGGSVETWDWCGRNEYVYCYMSYYGYVSAAATMQNYWNAMAALGKDRNPFRAGFLQFVGVAENMDEAIRLYKEPAEYFYTRSLHVDPRYATPPGYVSEATQRMKMKSQVKIAADRSQLFGSLKDEIAGILKEGYVIIGSPDEVAAQLRRIATEFNVGNLLLLLQFGNMDRDTTMYNTRLFAERVMPQLADLYEDEWEHKWWPKPLEQRVKARQHAVAAE